MGECKFNSNKRAFSILVSYFEEESVVEHYECIEHKIVNAENLWKFVNCLTIEISNDNLISDLSDNTNYMHGKKSGLKTKPCEKAPHLLDIGW